MTNVEIPKDEGMTNTEGPSDMLNTDVEASRLGAAATTIVPTTKYQPIHPSA